MTSRKSLSKRKYPCVKNKDGKWFTGYQEEYVTKNYIDKHYPDLPEMYDRFKTIREETEHHETKVLKLQPSHTQRGRSAANIVCKDTDGFEYLMSMKSIDNLLQALVSGKIVIQDGYFSAEFCQVKQGQNYFIDLVED